jgi:hypothetical protein
MPAARYAAELAKESMIPAMPKENMIPAVPIQQRLNDSRYPFCSSVAVNYYTDHALLLQYYKTAQVAYLSLSYPLYTFFLLFKKK